MKKIFTLLMTLVLVFSISDVALANQAKMTVSGKETVNRGEEVVYTVSLADCDKANTLGIEFTYDDKKLTTVINDCKWVNEGKLQNFKPEKNQGVWAVKTAKKLDGDVFKIVFKVNGDAPLGKTEVNVALTVKNDDVTVGKYTDTIEVNVVCAHAFGEYTSDEDAHTHVCKNCDKVVTEAHKWNSGKVTQAATATEPGTKTYTCSICKATKTEVIPATGETEKPDTDSTLDSEATTPETDKNQGGTATTPETTKPENKKPGNSKPSGSTTPSKEESAPAVEMKETVVKEKVEAIKKAEEGKEVVVEMKQADGKVATVVPVEILEAVKGKDVDVVLDMGEYSWVINGKDVAAEGLKDINLQVTLDTKNIEKTVVEELAGEDTVRQISLTHNGEFNFKAKLKINVGKDYAGKFGNLYYHNDGKLEFVSAAEVNEDGDVEFEFEHASDYVVVVGRDRTAEEQSQNSSVDADVPSTEEGTDTNAGDGGSAGTVIIVILVIAVIAAGIFFVWKKKHK